MKAFQMILPLSLVAMGCLAQDVRYNFDNSADFAKYKTYKWVDIKDGATLDQLREQQVKSAIDAELSRKGLSKAQGDAADLFIGYQAAINQEKQFTSYSTGMGGAGWGYGGGWGRYGGGGGFDSSMTTGQTSTIHVGSLGLDMYDSGQQKLIWRGMASKTIDAKAKPDKQQKNLAKAVTKLLKNYPPPVKK
jgi:hypothetical protein